MNGWIRWTNCLRQGSKTHCGCSAGGPQHLITPLSRSSHINPGVLIILHPPIIPQNSSCGCVLAMHIVGCAGDGTQTQRKTAAKYQWRRRTDRISWCTGSATFLRRLAAEHQQLSVTVIHSVSHVGLTEVLKHDRQVVDVHVKHWQNSTTLV